MNAPSTQFEIMDPWDERQSALNRGQRRDTGWINPKLHLPCDGRPVLVATRGIGIQIARWSESSNVWVGPKSDFREDFVAHWRELPEPPRVDAFEAWWEKLRVNNCYPSALARFVGDPAHQTTVMKQHARIIWEDALASASKDGPTAPHEPTDADENAAWRENESVYLQENAQSRSQTIRTMFSEGWNSAVLWYARQVAAANSSTKE